MVLALLSGTLTATLLVILTVALAGRRRTPPAEPVRTAPGAPVAAGAPGAASRRKPVHNAVGHFTAYTRTSGKNAPSSHRRALPKQQI